MKLNGDLVSYILGSIKDEDSGRVALYHYLKNFYPSHEPITPDLINKFYAEALYLPYWQEKRESLQNDILDLLQKFFTQAGFAFNLDQLWNLKRLRLLNITQIENLYLVIKNFEQSFLKEGESIRLIPDGESRIVTIKKNAVGEISVRTYNNLVRIINGQLLPLGPDQELHYDNGLELLANAIQKIRPAPHSQVRFVLHTNGIEAQFITGYALRQNQIQKLHSLSQDPRIFYPLKKLERFYVYRQSDPYYLELIATLDRAIEMSKNRTPDSETFARRAFEGGQIAFDQIFNDDKALFLRLKELAKTLTIRAEGTSSTVGTSGNPNSSKTSEVHR